MGELEIRRWRRSVVALALGGLVAFGALAQGGGNRGQRRGGRGGEAEAAMPADLAPLAALSVVAGRPTDRTVTLNVLSAVAAEGYVEYAPTAGGTPRQSAVTSLAAQVPTEVVLSDLQPNTAYAYRLRWRRPGETTYVAAATRSCHTARAAGSTFTFELQGDSHPERPQMFDPTLYARTLRAAAADRPDFYLALGDDFSVDKGGGLDAAAVAPIYRAQRLYLSLVDAPVFLVNGNHEQAARCNLDGTANNIAVWAGTCRNKYFALPAPDGFYTGDAEQVEHLGLLRDYYAWTWGEALFVVIDPYWHSALPVDNAYGTRDKRNRDLWTATLGEAQYRWLSQTLTASRAKFKFVFAHHVNGTGRGGIEQAGLYEWGGLNRRGETEFAQRRPGWGLPIHALMAKAGVTIFFQGHDHIFVKQQLDGVIYQTMPLPADPYYALYNRDAYRTGDALPGSGRVRVTVTPGKVSVAYVRSYLPKDETAAHRDGEIGYRYEVLATR